MGRFKLLSKPLCLQDTKSKCLLAGKELCLSSSHHYLQVDLSYSSANGGTTAEEVHQQPTASYWNNGTVPTWTGPLAYYNNDIQNDDMEGRFRTGLSYSLSKMTHRVKHTDLSISLTSGPGFATQTARQGSTPMEDSLFEINQTGLSPMWYDSCPYSFLNESLTLSQEGPFTGIGIYRPKGGTPGYAN